MPKIAVNNWKGWQKSWQIHSIKFLTVSCR